MTHLMLPCVEMIHVDQRYSITVLVFVQDKADLVEEKLDIKPGRVVAQFMVHNNLQEQR